MTHRIAAEEIINSYFISTVDATRTLYEKQLYGHMLVVLFSSIDTMGLLDASPFQIDATGDSFKNWVKKYLLQNPDIEFSDVDLWAARCSVLHTFTSESKLSRNGQAKQLQYYGGDKSSEQAQHFIAYTKGYEDGAHLPVHFEDLYGAFLSALRKFVPDLDANCQGNAAYETRLRKVLMTNNMSPAP